MWLGIQQKTLDDLEGYYSYYGPYFFKNDTANPRHKLEITVFIGDDRPDNDTATLNRPELEHIASCMVYSVSFV